MPRAPQERRTSPPSLPTIPRFTNPRVDATPSVAICASKGGFIRGAPNNCITFYFSCVGLSVNMMPFTEARCILAAYRSSNFRANADSDVGWTENETHRLAIREAGGDHTGNGCRPTRVHFGEQFYTPSNRHARSSSNATNPRVGEAPSASAVVATDYASVDTDRDN